MCVRAAGPAAPPPKPRLAKPPARISAVPGSIPRARKRLREVREVPIAPVSRVRGLFLGRKMPSCKRCARSGVAVMRSEFDRKLPAGGCVDLAQLLTMEPGGNRRLPPSGEFLTFMFAKQRLSPLSLGRRQLPAIRSANDFLTRGIPEVPPDKLLLNRFILAHTLLRKPRDSTQGKMPANISQNWRRARKQ